MPRSIKLSWATSHYRLGTDDGVRLRVVASCAEGLSDSIFAYRLLPTGVSGEAEATFDHVCSPPDMADYPENQPRDGEEPPWFRLSFLDVMVRSVSQADNAIAIIQSDVNRLISTLNKMDTLFHTGAEVFGSGVDCDAPEPDPDEDPEDPGSSIALGDVLSITTTGTSEQSIGYGVPWVETGVGAGSPTEGDDGDSTNRSRVPLAATVPSQLLLVQGFDFSTLPDDAVITGVEVRVVLRNATAEDQSSSEANSLSLDLPETSYPTLDLLAIQHTDAGSGTNAATGQLVFNDEYMHITAGDGDDLWGLALQPVQLKDGAFGVGLVIGAAKTRPTIVEVDGVVATVYYREVL